MNLSSFLWRSTLLMALLTGSSRSAMAAPPTLSVNDVSVTEGNSGTANAAFTVKLSAASAAPVTVKYATANGTALAGTDYTALPLTTLTFAAGQTSKTVNVAVKGDLIDEADETFSFKLSAAAGATIADATGTSTIKDDDTSAINVTGATVTEGNSGTVPLNFTLTLSRANSRVVTVVAKTSTAATFPATAGSDYEAYPATTITFAAGQTSKVVAVKVKGDLLDDETKEYVGFTLSSPINAVVGTVGQGIILDDDATPSLSVNDVSLVEDSWRAVTAQFKVALSAPTTKTVTVKYATGNQTATAGADYTALPAGTLTFAPGQTQKALNVTILADTLDEVDETFALKLSAATNATISDASGIGNIVDNDASPTLSLDSTALNVTEGDSGSTTVALKVRLSAVSGRNVTVQYATLNGTATAGEDYVAIPATTLTFSPGQTVKSFNVSVTGDRVGEETEDFSVNSAQCVGAVLDSNKASTLVQILNDDNSPPVAFDNSDFPDDLGAYSNGDTVHFTLSPNFLGYDPDGDTLTITAVDAQGVELVNGQLVVDETVGVYNPYPYGHTFTVYIGIDFTISDGIASTAGTYWAVYYVYVPGPGGDGEDFVPSKKSTSSTSGVSAGKPATIPSVNRS